MQKAGRQTVKEKLIIVGTGDYYYRILLPSLLLLRQEGLAEIIATVSTSKKRGRDRIAHVVRGRGERLSELLARFKKKNPIVVLGHTNELHAEDTHDLLKNGFRVFLEKPYAVSTPDLHMMQQLMRLYPRQLVLLEYYLMMKAIPLLVACGKVRPESFYFKKEGILKYYDDLPPSLSSRNAIQGCMEQMVGTPRFVLAEVLEGEGDVGRVDHRGAALSDAARGGGMIQDLGIHAVTALFAIEDYIGKIDPGFRGGRIRIAQAREYVAAIQKNFSLPPTRIAESYAEFQFTTSRGVPVFVAVGKYTPKDRNQRRIVIVGSEGRLYLDLSSCTLYLAKGDGQEVPVLQTPKMPESKYYPVMRAALEGAQGISPFTFDASSVALKTQEFILSVLQKSMPLRRRPIPRYKTGTEPYRIFKRI